MSGQKRIILSENQIEGGSEEQLAKELLNANEEANVDEKGEKESKKE